MGARLTPGQREWRKSQNEKQPKDL